MVQILHIPAEQTKDDPFQHLSSFVSDKSGEEIGDDAIPEEGKLALDIFETEDDLVFLAPMAGVHPDRIEIQITEDVLSISGERHFPRDIFAADPSPFLEECYWGKFSRSIVLPAAVNSENISAKLRDGILMIVVPKAKKAKSKKVPIEIL